MRIAVCRSVLLASALISSLLGQSQSASLTGVVTDSSGAAVPRAALRLVNTETGEAYQAGSNDSGNYDFPLLKPGRYNLTAELAGFKQVQQTGVILETGVPTRVDLKLEVGAITDKVTVEAVAPLVQSETASVGSVVQNQTIVDMPLIDRRGAQLAKLNGFVVQNGTGSSPQFSMAGGRGNNANWRMDGGNNNNILLGTSGVGFDPPVDSLQEFNVSISNYSAELGRSGGGVILMTTKSGTNDLHGSAYEYFRNTALNTRSFFAAKVPILHYNLFGASVGGPVRKNRTFFFFNYEGLRQKTQTTQILNIPSPAQVRGDFSADTVAVRDPAGAGRPPFPGNLIPTDRLDPIGAKIAAFYPVPNLAGRPPGNSNFIGTTSDIAPNNYYIGRADHNIRDSDRVYGRVLKSGGPVDDTPAYTSLGADSFQKHQENRYLNLSGSWIHNFSSAALNETRYTYDRRKYIDETGGTGSGLNGKLGIAGVDPNFFGQFTIAGLQGFGGTTEQQRLQTPIVGNNFADTVTLIRGNHQIKFGFEWRNSQNQDIDRQQAGGTYNFNITATGSSLAALLLGWVNSSNVNGSAPIQSRAASYGTFVQDDWKITPRLTLNIGLRWDLDVPRSEANNRQNSFDTMAINPVSGTPGIVTWSGRNGLGKYAHNFDYTDFGPRLGFAYRVGDKWVVRGGTGLVYTGEYDQATPTLAQLGYNTSGSFVSPDNGLTPALLLKNGIPPVAYPTQAQLTSGYGAVPVGASTTTAVDFFVPKGRKVGYLEQFNFNIQRALAKDLLMEVGYLSTLGHHLPAPAALTINQVPMNLMGPGNAQVRRPFPQFSNVITDVPDIGNSNYHGMNVKVDKRYSRGLHFLANYTFSRFIDDVASRNALDGVTSDYQNIYNRKADRGLSGYNIAHRFVFSSVWELPVGKGKAFDPKNPFLNQVVGGWSTGYIAVLQTGVAYGVVELTNTTNSFSPSLRPNVVGDSKLSGDRSKAAKLGQWFNTAAFAPPALYTFGNAGRTDGYGPGLMSMDISILKEFSLWERHRLEFRTEILNFLNHANFGLPNVSQGNAAFGQINALVGGSQSRIVQLGLHYKF
jgi:hypothetical protein